MRRKFFKIILLIKFFVISFNLTSLNVLANCTSFMNDLKELQYRYLPTTEHENFGFDLMQIYNFKTKNWEYKKKNGNFLVGKIFNGEALKNIKSGYEIISANNKKFTLDLFYSDKEELNFTFLDNENNVINLDLEQKTYDPYSPEIDIKSLDINKIDTKNGYVELELKYDFIADFDDSYEQLWKTVTDNIIVKKDDGKYTYYVCDYSLEEFQETGMYLPEDGFELLNTIQTNKNLIKDSTYKFTPYSKKIGNKSETLSVMAMLGGYYKIKNKFNLKTFPFDRQKIAIQIVDKYQKIPNNIIYESGLSYEKLNYILEKNDISGWNIKSFNFKYLQYQDPYFMDEDYSDGLELEMIIERKHSYYLYKVILPIILILSVCWLVVWIDPKELEARLTVTIVCLLSLIAYNFVIDSELPKLEYLTVLDWIILTSYVYAVIPNILSVVSFRLQKSNAVSLSNKIEFISTRYGILSYFVLVIFIILINANINPDNSTALISWMTFR